MADETVLWPDMPGYAGACRNCRRPLFEVDGVGILHGEHPNHVDSPMTCDNPEPHRDRR